MANNEICLRSSAHMDQIKRVASPFRFHIPEDLIPELRGLRARQRDWSALIDAEDVVHLYYGLGPARFLAFDGVVEAVQWADLRMVFIHTTDAGPAADDVIWVWAVANQVAWFPVKPKE